MLISFIHSSLHLLIPYPSLSLLPFLSLYESTSLISTSVSEPVLFGTCIHLYYFWIARRMMSRSTTDNLPFALLPALSPHFSCPSPNPCPAPHPLLASLLSPFPRPLSLPLKGTIPLKFLPTSGLEQPPSFSEIRFPLPPFVIIKGKNALMLNHKKLSMTVCFSSLISLPFVTLSK